MIDWDRCTQISEKIKESAADVSFLSEIVIDDDDLEYIIKNSNIISITDKPSAYILTAYLMVVAGRNFDRSYWPHLCDLMGVANLDNKDRNDLKEAFQKGLCELGLAKDIETQRNVEQYLVHTVVPDKEEYMNNFFSFISSFYKDVLKFELPDDYAESFDLLSAIIRGDVQDDQFPPTYALNKCTIYALGDPQNYDKIMVKILNIIDAGYKGRKISGLGNNRFAIPFQKWYMDNIGSRSRSSLRREMEMRRARMALSSGKVRILIPQMKCTANASLIVKSGRKILKEIPMKTFQIRVQDQIVNKMANDLNLEPKELGVEPFDKFQIEIDGHSVLSSTAREFLLFNEDQVRINSLNIGINHILVKNPDIVPECETSKVRKEEYKGLYYCDLKEGDELVIGETHLTVMPADSTTEGINITPLEDVTAVSEMEIMPVCTDFDILCFISNVKPSSKIYARITLDNEPPYHRVLNVSSNNISNGSFVTRLLEDEHTTTGIHTVFIELIHNNQKVDDSRFMLVPGYEHKFDCKKPAYVEETHGTLTMSSPIEGSVEFPTSDMYVDVPLPNLDMRLRHKIPTLRIRTGDNKWRSPGNYDIDINDFTGDYLWVSSDCPSSLYHNKKPIPRHVAEDYYVYDFHKIHEMYNSENIHNVEIEVSLDSKPRFHLCNIWVCNNYQVTEKEDAVEVNIFRHTLNKVFLRIPESGDEYEIINDSALIQKPECNVYSIIIDEKDQYGIRHSMFSQQYYKTPIFVENMTDRSCNLHCYDKKIQLTYCKKTLTEMMTDYDSKSRYSPWMKDVRSKVLDYLKSIGIKG